MRLQIRNTLRNVDLITIFYLPN